MPRNKKPGLIRKLEGNRSRTSIPDNPKGVGEPVCNPYLNADEQRFWFAIVDSLPGGLLSRADEQVLERAAIAWARMWDCRKMIEEQGMISQGANGPIKNPLLMVEKDAREELHRAGEVLGLSPVARTRITAPDADPNIDPTEQLMAGIEGGAWRDVSDPKTSSVVPFRRVRKKKGEDPPLPPPDDFGS